jgi:hypothetical protein
MFMKKYKFVYILLFILLVGCTSIEDVVTETKDLVKKEFNSGAKGVNVEAESFSYYMPTSMEVETEGDFNIILTEGKQPYILFVNTMEKKDSHVVYESSLTDQDYLVNETYEKEDKFGFLQVIEIKDKLYEVSVGVGGVKLTTEVKKNNIADSARKMMKIANSVRY